MSTVSSLRPLEIFILFSADENGRIPFPDGSASVVASKMSVLKTMEEKGFVCRRRNVRFNLGVYLTEAGTKAKQAIGQVALGSAQ
jgi:hypothetical protein